MKKMLSAILVAVAFAAVNTVDAKRMVQVSDAKTISTTAKNAVNNPTEDNKQDVVDTLAPQNLSVEEQELVALRVDEKDLMNKIASKKEEISNLNYGLFGFGTTKETQDAHRAAKADLAQLNADLKKVQVDIAKKTKVTGISFSRAAKYAVGVAGALGLMGILYDLYYGKGYTASAMTEVRGGMPRTRKYIRETGEAVQKRYRTMRGTVPAGK